MVRACKERCVYKTTLKVAYGLTDKMIRELGEPDKRGVNLNYTSGPRTSLYREQRVLDYIATLSEDERRKMQERVRRYAEQQVLRDEQEHRQWEEAERAAQRARECSPEEQAVATRWAEEQEMVASAVPGDLYERAQRFFRGDYGDTNINHQQLLNFARHNLTNYDALLVKMGRQGFSFGAQDLARALLKQRVNEMLASVVSKAQPEPGSKSD